MDRSAGNPEQSKKPDMAGVSRAPRYHVHHAEATGAAASATLAPPPPAWEAPPAGAPAAPSTTPPGKAPPARKVAVFVAHGMGQQIPFQTLDQVAEGLRRVGEARGRAGFRSDVRSVKFEEQWLNRVELTFGDASPPVEAHVYEGYWAPLTEGRIDTRGVIRFLYGAGVNGLKNGGEGVQRWLFGRYWLFDAPVRIVLYLIVALLAVGALVVMNGSIAVVAAGRALLSSEPDWLTDGLFADLTTTFNAVVTTMAVFGLVLVVARVLRKRRASPRLRRAWGGVSAVAFAAALFVLILGGLSLALLFYSHVKLGPAAADVELWHHVFPARVVDGFNDAFDVAALTLAVVAVGGALLFHAYRLARGIVDDITRREGRWLTAVAGLFLVLVAVAGVWLAVRLLGVAALPVTGNVSAGWVASGLGWMLLVAASAYIRKALVQYVGDVAIYVTPYTLDEYFELREQIEQCVQKTARAVYALRRDGGSEPLYDEVIVVGHSLGSVIVYDVLNALINDDDATAGGKLDVVRRTPLLLTFGSPLDKTAFIFAVQRNHTTEAREALGASVQPLIRDYSLRPERWINLYSPWDIISGSLGFYDPPAQPDDPEARGPRRIENVEDPEATTLLAAHVEYWQNPLLFDTLYRALEGKTV